MHGPDASTTRVARRHPPSTRRDPSRRNRERLLDAAAHAYVNHPRGARVTAGGEIHASSIYEWFEEDFGDSERDLLQHLGRFAEAPLAVRLRDARGIAGYDYDWSLNDVRR